MQKRDLKEFLPLNLFLEGGNSHRFIQQQNMPTVDLHEAALDDRSLNASNLLQDYLSQVNDIPNLFSIDDKGTTQADAFQIAAQWVSARFEHDKQRQPQSSKELNRFYYNVMKHLITAVENLGKARFVKLLESNGLLDMACSNGNYYIDWLTFLVMKNRHATAAHLIFCGFNPKAPGSCDFLEFKEPHNTTALCYLHEAPYTAALLERAGFAANTTKYLKEHEANLHWLTDISLYPAPEYADFRANYMRSVCQAWATAHSNQDERVDFNNWLAQSSLFSSLSYHDTHKAAVLFSATAIRNAMRGILRTKMDLIRDGAFDAQADALPHWMTLSPDMPLILAKESNEHRKLILNYTGLKYQHLIRVLSNTNCAKDHPPLDAYLIYTKAPNSYVLDCPDGTLISFAQFRQLIERAFLENLKANEYAQEQQFLSISC